MNLWHYILRVPFDGDAYVDIFRKVVPQLTIFNFMTQIRLWLRWLRCFARIHIKIVSIVTTLTTLINSFIKDYADYADIQDNTKSSSITEFTDHLVFNTRFRESIPSLTTLTT